MKLASISLLFAVFAAVIYAAALDTSYIHALEARDAEDQPVFEDVVGYQLPDGHRKIDFYLNGALAGSAVETSDGVEFFDEAGDLIDLDNQSEFAKRVSRWQFAIKFAKLLAKYGKRAWDFFYCIGLNAGWRCSDDFLQCATMGQPPWACAEGIVCVGAAAVRCK
ncbi:hypothetical protein BKA66DRAFT_569243 [Pyrenochaeta sp. MPI-SDFR-AT-0127]|nr:hypothetical protein BKA66DRAFT_569243 [Pyrenochaeta sp. MPI-SDFR-AT-0127]